MNHLQISKSTLFLTVAILFITATTLLLMLAGPNRLTGPKQETVTYNGFEFENVDGLWRTAWQRGSQPYELEFRFNPVQVEGIPVEGNTDARFQQQNVYITFDPSDNRTSDTSYVALAAVELSRKLVDPFERNVIAACTKNETQACSNRPIITCENTNSSVIYLKQADEAKIVLNGNCVTLQGRGDGIVMTADRALFEWLGIMRG